MRTKFKDFTKGNINNNFWKWFGNSKIVDNNGNPLVVYRTQKTEIPHGNFKEPKMIYGIYFSQDKDSTLKYGQITKEYYLKIENPKILRGFEFGEPWDLSIITRDKYNKLKEDGFDGAIWMQNEKMYEIVVFDKWRIKSTENDGSWDLNDDIYS